MNIRSYIAQSGWHGNAWMLAIGVSEAAPWQGLVLHRRDGELRIVESVPLNDEQGLQNWLKRYPQSPIVLAIDADQIAEGFIPPNAEPISAVLQVQMADRSAFVWQQFKGEDEMLTALMRKEALQDYLDMLGPAQTRVVSISLSPAVLCNLIPAWADYQAGNTYQIADYGYDQGIIVQASGVPLSNGELAHSINIQEEALYPYGAAVQYLQSEGNDLHNIDTFPDNRSRLKTQWQWLRGLVIGALILIVVGGASNSAVVVMEDTIQEAAILAQSNVRSLDQIEANRTQLSQQVALLQQAQTGSLKPHEYALLVNRMATVCPKEVHFAKLILPVEADDWKRLDLPGDMPEGLLIGFADKASALTQFSESLRSLPDLDNPELIQGAYDRRSNSYPFSITFDLP